MPFLRVDVGGPLAPDVKRRLLRDTAELFAEITASPIERVRTQVLELPADSFAVGGVTIAESGQQAPFVTVELLEGRPPTQKAALIERMTVLVAAILGAPVERTRLRINEVDAELWGIAGVPAAQARGAEVAARRKA